MKGIIFNVLENFVIETAGQEKFEEILSKCKLQTKEPFVGPGNYPDEDLLEIVGNASHTLGIEAPELVRMFGKFLFAELAEKFPVFMKEKTAWEFIKTIEEIPHIEVKKLYPDAKPPQFEVEETSPDEIALHYKSKRKLCALAKGLIQGVSEYYKTPIEIKETKCMLNGADECVFELKFGG